MKGGIVSLLLLLMAVVLPASLLPLPSGDSPQYLPDSWKPCVNPEECCRYPRDTVEFDECCDDHGCCPLSCPRSKGVGNFTIRAECDEAWECCRFRPNTPEFNHCCFAHGCCPLCDQVSKGCCYNGLRYDWGSVVEEFPDMCLELVCAAQVSTHTTPVFTSAIVPVKLQNYHCKDDDSCDCIEYCCVDTGLVHAEGAKWFPDECHECVCTNGSVKCHKFEISCPLQPYPYCVEIPGPCCSEWDCTVGCLDESGNHHEEESVWYTNPCVYHKCTEDGIKTEFVNCVLGHPTHPSCRIYFPEGECCPLWNCSGCFEDDGTHHEQGEEWTKGDPCVSYKCTEIGIKVIRLHCDDIRQNHPGCYEYTSQFECCPKLNCSGCVDHTGTHRPFDEEWKTDPCTTHVCTRNGIQTTREECHLGPSPHPTCYKYSPLRGCCPLWHCSGCFDDTDRFREIDEEWNTGDPCVSYICTHDEVKILRVRCSDVLSHHPGCFEYTPEGKCCPKLNCSGCVDENGTYRPLNDVWKTDPCTTHVCTKNGIHTAREECRLGPAPHPSCSRQTPTGECCSEWQCSGCFDKSGGYHELGHEWNTGDVCIKYTCTVRGFDVKRIQCRRTTPPHPSCHEYIPEGECCPEWNCSGCVDHANAYHPVHDVWRTDPCTTHTCTKSGIQTRREDCHLGPAPHPTSCLEYTPPGECCPEWHCSGCYDDGGLYHAPGHEWNTGDPCLMYTCEDGVIKISYIQCGEITTPHPGCYEYTPAGECCPKLDCSGCIDHDETYHPIHDVWKTDICTTHICTTSGIQTEREDCRLRPAPHPSCLEYVPEGKCCPEWQCRGCFDDHGNFHEVGHEWTTSDPCLTFLCTEEGISTERERCEDTPHPGCYQYTVEGVCCPRYNCSGCVDDRDDYHPLYDVWKTGLCTTHVCTKNGIHTTREECHLGPKPHQSCVKYTTPGECCPEWQCSGCFDKSGDYYEVGREWNSGDPCMKYVCTEGGITKTKLIKCEDIPPPHPSCYEYIPEGECCPKWNCSGCDDHEGNYHPLFDVWKTDLCTTHVCTKSGIQTTREECYLGPAPHPSCLEYTAPGECCPDWHCSGCFDDESGIYYEVGQEWSAGDPCMYYHCTKEGIETKLIQCEDLPALHSGCYQYTPEGECCPVWNCSGCLDHTNAYHPLFDVWKTDLCTTHVCLRTGIQTTREECRLGPAPYPDCNEYTPPGECCSEWQCSGCFDEVGTYHESGQEWNTGDPCVSYLCTEGEIKTERIHCQETAPPHPSCYHYIPVGECCPVWNCSGCVDDVGTFRKLNDVWKTDVCTTHVCTRNGIQTTREKCYLGPAPHPSCREYSPRGECCSEWQCSGCIDDAGDYYELGQEWKMNDPCIMYKCTEGGVIKITHIECEDVPPPQPSCYEYLPAGECCPQWNCSGCVDHKDAYHPLYDVWKTDICTTHVCTNAGIQTTREECYLGPAPHPSCLEYTAPGECCPDWHCSGCFDDESGIYYEVGQEWSAGDPCMYYHCTKEGIETKLIQCEDLPALHSGCYQYTPEGECCPVWNCSGCLDHTNAYHPLFDVWKTDICTTHVCLRTGIQTTREECRLGPAPYPDCNEYTPPGECCSEWQCSGCFDEVGTYHESGHEWNTGDPCVSYLCTEGEIKIERLHCQETAPPHPSCYHYIPVGECCPVWNCSGCVDDVGTFRKLNDVWKTDVCTTHVCTRNGIQTTREKCYLGPAPHPSCREYTPRGECCSEWQCSGCIDDAGDYYELGQEWKMNDPCIMYKCTEGGVIKVTHIECEDVPPPQPSCYEYLPAGECCPQWNCSGCVDHKDAYHPLYDVWKTDICTTHVCTNAGIQTTREECYLGPAPHPSCLEYTAPGECCPDWHCSGCFDAGHYYELGHEWNTGDPCILYTCAKEGVEIKLIHCQDTRPLHSGCYEYTPEGECCPVWNCSGCVDHEGTYHPLHDVWRTDNCATHVCTNTGIRTTREECQLGPAPHPSCEKYAPSGECCPEWHCSGCFDTAGDYYELGYEWTKNNPCVTYVCTEYGIDVNHVHCEETLPLHPNCFDYIPDGECCSKWNCSGCVDYSGKYYSLYSVWQTDPCTIHECTNNGIHTTNEECKLGPAPHYTCEQFTLPGECCPDWKCSGCFDEYGGYHELGHVWNADDPCIVYECTEEGLVKRNVECKETIPPHAGCYEYKAEGECCPVWNCSGCVDHTETYHPLYDVWKTDICTTHVCTKSGIQTTREECYLGPAPHYSCVEYTPPGECCPEWECSGCFESGIYHEVGQEWNTSDPCIFLLCTKDGVKTKLVDCEETRQPHSGCYEYTPAGECCPKWNCSGCVDEAGTHYPLYHVWGSDPCIVYVCTRTGIQTSTEECQYLGPPPYPSCEKVVPPGECCPEWECSGCVDDYGVHHPLHKEWVTDDCTAHTCTVNGILTTHKKCYLDPAPHYSCREYTPEGECCPIWNCSGCIEKSGEYRELHSEWQTGPCITHTCGETGIRTVLEKCQEKPQPHCEEIPPPPGVCCPEWRCSGCYKDGEHHLFGSSWQTDPCTTFLCTDDGIKVTKEYCDESSPPHDGCVKYTPTGECCPTWNCSGCIDAYGNHHQLNDEWLTDPCTIHLCTSVGIEVTTKVCVSEPQSNSKCQEYTPPGECCPLWKCPTRSFGSGFLSSVVLDGCMDDNGERHKYGNKWEDPSDSCYLFECLRHGVIHRYYNCD